MRDNRDDSNGGKVKRFSYVSSKANQDTNEDWDFIKPAKKQDDGLGRLGDLDDVWSIRKNVSLGNNGPNTSKAASIPPINSSLTTNTGFYSRHGQTGKNNVHNRTISPTDSFSEFQGTSGFSWNQPRGGGGGYSYSNQEHNSSPDFSNSPSPRGVQVPGRIAGTSGGLQAPGRIATHGNTRNMQMGGVYPRSPKPDRHSPHNSKGRPANNSWPNF